MVEDRDIHYFTLTGNWNQVKPLRWNECFKMFLNIEFWTVALSFEQLYWVLNSCIEFWTVALTLPYKLAVHRVLCIWFDMHVIITGQHNIYMLSTLECYNIFIALSAFIHSTFLRLKTRMYCEIAADCQNHIDVFWIIVKLL